MTPDEFANLPFTERVKLEFGAALRQIAEMLAIEAAPRTTEIVGKDRKITTFTMPGTPITAEHVYQYIEAALEQRVAAYCGEAYRQGYEKARRDFERRYAE